MSVRRAWFWFVSQGPIVVAFVLLAGAVLSIAVFQPIAARQAHNDLTEQLRINERLRTQVDRFQFEQECRFELTQPLAEIQAEKQDAFDAGLVAIVRDDQAELTRQIERIERAQVREQAALADRGSAVDTCNRRAEGLFG